MMVEEEQKNKDDHLTEEQREELQRQKKENVKKYWRKARAVLKILSIINMITKDINKYGANQNMENMGKNQVSFNLDNV